MTIAARHHHHHPHRTSFTVATINDDFNSPRTNVPHVHADVKLVQEAKNVDLHDRLRHDKFGVHQNTRRVDQQGTAVVWEKDRFHAKRSGYAMGVEPHGRKMETRWINYTDVTVDGVKVRMASVHRPPLRFKALWPEFDRHLAHFVKHTKLPLIIGMDSNTHQPHVMERLTGLKWRSPPGSIDGFLVSPGIRVDHLHRLAKGSSDHNPVVGKFHVKG